MTSAAIERDGTTSGAGAAGPATHALAATGGQTLDPAVAGAGVRWRCCWSCRSGFVVVYSFWLRTAQGDLPASTPPNWIKVLTDPFYWAVLCRP